MDEQDRGLLRSHHVRLCQVLHAGLVAKKLLEGGIFSQEDVDAILAEPSTNKQNERLLSTLPRKGPLAFSSFLQALREADLPHQFLLDNQKGVVHADHNDSTDPSPRKVHIMEPGFDEVPEGGYDKTDAPPCMEPGFDEVPEGGYDKTDAPPTCLGGLDVGSSQVSSEPDGRFGIGGSKPPKAVAEVQPARPVHCAPRLDPVSQLDLEPDSFYPMSKKTRGLCIIINNKDFEASSGMENYPRNGTDVDAKAFRELFEELGFEVECHKNKTCYEMRRILKQASVLDFSRYSAFCCCMLSHGQEGTIYGVDGMIEIRELTAYFRGRNLAGKPKMFFFQACQGSEYMDAVEPDGAMEVDGPTDYGNDISLPTESDFVYAYSTVPGYYSWRNSSKGSWFIQAIIEVFRRDAHKVDLVRMLTRVNGIVSTKKSQTGQRASHNKRQISTIVSQLRKELYFFPPSGPLRQVEVQW